MKKYIILIVALTLVLAGLIGSLVCIFPGHSKEYKVINKYVSAADDCDMEKIYKCMPMEELSSVLSMYGEDLMRNPNLGVTDKMTFIRNLGMDVASKIPEDAQSVKQIKLISCTPNESSSQSMLGVSMSEYLALVEVTYVSAEGEEVTVTGMEEFGLIQTQKGMKILSA